jgi:hypothetical protein
LVEGPLEGDEDDDDEHAAVMTAKRNKKRPSIPGVINGSPASVVP